MFAKNTIEKFLNLKNVGLIKNASGVGANLEETCKNTFKIYLSIDKDKVIEAKFKAFGNPSFVSICDEIVDLVVNKKVDEVINISNDEIKEIISKFDGLKSYNASFFKVAIENAVKDYRKKQIKLKLKEAK